MVNKKHFFFTLGLIIIISFSAIFILSLENFYNSKNSNDTGAIGDRDTINPSWDQQPENQTAFTADHYIYDINASDDVAIDQYWLSETTNFQINEKYGIVTNATILSIGYYSIIINVNDTSGNEICAEIIITVIDNTFPSWIEIPTNQAGNSATKFRYDVNATDNTAISQYWINDTKNFKIDEDNGTITNNTIVLGGDYWLEICTNDTAGNKINAIIRVSYTPSVTILEGNETIECNEAQYFTAQTCGFDDRDLEYQWYIDGVNKSGPLPRTPNYLDDFESLDWSGGPWDKDSGWSIENMGNNGGYNALAIGGLSNRNLTIKQNFNLTNSTNTKLSFWQYAYNTESTDSCYIDVSVDNGTTWNEIRYWKGNVLNDINYSLITIDLSKYDGESQFRYQFRCNFSDSAEGWRIDDIKLNGTAFRTENKLFVKFSPDVNTTYDIKVKAIDNSSSEEDTVYLKVICDDAHALSLIIDTGGSMQEEISDAQNTAKELVKKLSNHSSCAFYTFDGNDRPEFVVPMIQMDQENIFGTRMNGRQYLLNSIDNISSPSGYSPIWDTLWEAIAYTMQSNLEGKTKKVVLITDGQDTASSNNNYGNDDSDEFPDGDNLGRQGSDDENDKDDFGLPYIGSDGIDGGVCNVTIEVYTIGLGVSSTEEDKLKEVALTSSGGTYLNAPSSDDLDVIIS